MALLNIYPSQAPQSYPPYRGIGDFGVIAKRGAIKPTTPKTRFFSGAKGGKHGKLHTMRL